MRAEEVHREKLKQLGLKDEAIEELVNKCIANCTYEFAEAYHAELLNKDSVGNSLNFKCGCCKSPHDMTLPECQECGNRL